MFRICGVRKDPRDGIRSRDTSSVHCPQSYWHRCDNDFLPSHIFIFYIYKQISISVCPCVTSKAKVYTKSVSRGSPLLAKNVKLPHTPKMYSCHRNGCDPWACSSCGSKVVLDFYEEHTKGLDYTKCQPKHKEGGEHNEPAIASIQSPSRLTCPALPL